MRWEHPAPPLSTGPSGILYLHCKVKEKGLIGRTPVWCNLYSCRIEKAPMIQDEGWMSYEVERVEGDLLYIKGAQFPFKGGATEELVNAANIFKRFFRFDVTVVWDAMEFVLKYDWAYRIRFLDLCTELNPKNGPFKEIGRLLSINKARDDIRVHKKIRAVGNLLRFAMLFPSMRARYWAWVPNRPVLDDLERYWGYQKLDYNLEGKNFYQRMGEMQKREWKLPPNNLV